MGKAAEVFEREACQNGPLRNAGRVSARVSSRFAHAGEEFTRAGEQFARWANDSPTWANPPEILADPLTLQVKPRPAPPRRCTTF